MRHLQAVLVAILFGTPLFFSVTASAQIKLDGYLIARGRCSAYSSIRNQSNPHNVTTEVDRAYDLVGKNKAAASHYLIMVPNAQPKRRWVRVDCGEHVVRADGSARGPGTGSGSGTGAAPDDPEYVLAVSWQPAFCEKRPHKAECRNMTNHRFDTSHFVLHGLWPQPRDNVFCNVDSDYVRHSKNGRWDQLPELVLSDTHRAELSAVMPGTQSFLHRHEWTKHGTCYNSESADKYYGDSLVLMRALNSSVVRELFAENIGQKIQSAAIRERFDAAFGDGAGERVRVSCKRDGNRQLITELLISLKGPAAGPVSLGDMILHAPTTNAGCESGTVDPSGLQ